MVKFCIILMKIIYTIQQDIHIYICYVLPAKRLDRLGGNFFGHSWVAGGVIG